MTPFIKNICCILLCLSVLSLRAQEVPSTITTRLYSARPSASLQERFNKVQVLRLTANELAAFSRATPEKVNRINWHIGEQPWSLQLSAKPASADKVSVTTSRGGVQPLLHGPLLLTGTMQDGKGRVRLAVNDHFIYGFLDNGTDRYFIEPLRKFDTSASKEEYIFYHVNDVPLPGNFCGTTEMSAGNKYKVPATSAAAVSSPASQRASCKQVRMAVATDYAVYEKHGSTELIANYIIANWHVAESYFVDLDLDQESTTDVGDDHITMPVVALYIVTDPDNDLLPNGSFSLLAFGNWANAHFQAPFDIAEMITGKSIPLGPPNAVLGVATGMGQLCNARKEVHVLRDYLNGASYSLVTAHETGHNLGCAHDDELSPAVRSFIMTSYLVRTATRFSRYSDFVGIPYETGSAWNIKRTFEWGANACLHSNLCSIDPCERVKGLTLETVGTQAVRLSWQGTAPTYIVQYKVKDSAIFPVANTVEVTGTEITISGLRPCTPYEFLVKAKCDASTTSIPVIVPYQLSSFRIDSIVAGNAANGRYDLSFHLHYLNSNADQLQVTAMVDGQQQRFDFSGASQRITLTGLRIDGRLLKRLHIYITDYGPCYTAATFRAPVLSNDCTPLATTDFNDGKVPAGWISQVTRHFPLPYEAKYLAIGFNDRAGNGGPFPYGNIDSTRMTFYDFWNNGIQKQFGTYEIFSPVLDISNKTGVTLSFDYAYFRTVDRRSHVFACLKADVFDGHSWVNVWMVDSSQQYINYTGSEFFWHFIPPRITIGLDPYRNPQFQVRFTLIDGSKGTFTRGLDAAALDNILICGADVCASPVNAPLPQQRGAVHAVTAVKACTDADYFTHYFSAADSLLISFKKQYNDSLELYPNQVKLQHYTTSLAVNASRVPYVQQGWSWVLLNKYWVVNPWHGFSDTGIVRLYIKRQEVEALCAALGIAYTTDIIRPYYLSLSDTTAFAHPVHAAVTAGTIVFPYAVIRETPDYYVIECIAPPSGGVLGIGASAKRWQPGQVAPLLLYPNPVTDLLIAEVNTTQEGNMYFEIVNTLGQVVRAEKRLLQGGFNRLSFPVKGLAAGMYLLRSPQLAPAKGVRFIKL
ncbi:T9SS type A sorting domain-containing protein [Pseudoflavitalea sp. X16]|uniref:M12 family metallo-peptidase n=1 Tax=Paraflavitalea devenefica TaxID=2716334 RepID=UPI001421BF75|nr:M12 family metallo-peptidase [Paraflavitalea devenefica]NII27066.1 T9SS type A sorting domain-containing protein [Paraflavitalea devenefica]